MTKSRLASIENLEEQFVDLEGNLQGPLDITGWYVPEVVNIEGENLIWRWFANSQAGKHAKKVRAKPGIIWSFIRLHGAVDEEILRFARKWGMLYLCSHGLPARHVGDTCLPLGDWIGLNGRNYEPLASWREYSERTHEMLSEAASIHTQLAKEAKEGISLEVQNRQVMLSMKVQSWLNQAGVNIEFFWQAGKQRVKLGTHSLFAAISVELMAIVSKTRGLAICSNCGDIYIPSRLPRIDQRNYCDKEECRQAAWRDAKKDKRLGKSRRRKKKVV